VPDAWRARGRAALDRAGAAGAGLVVHPGAGGRSKRWPPASFAGVLEAVATPVGGPIVVHEGPADAEPAAALLARLGPRAVRLVRPELDELAGVLASCAAYLGADSGVSHLAAAVGAPAVVVYPPETADRWAAWSPTSRRVMMGAQPDDVEGVIALLGQVVGRP
jgi:ADP-heptose:LPS heptosyltransferase